MPSSPTLGIVVVGARRGQSFVRTVKAAGGELVGVCDTDPTALQPWKQQSDLRLYADFGDVLNDDRVDAVCLATPAHLHAAQSIAALAAGKHVLTEVPAIDTVEEGRRLIEVVEKSGRTFMMAENYCYRRDVLMVQNMIEQGVFGELTYASGAYLHDCRELFFHPDGSLTWRGQRRRDLLGNTYPTHAIGPVCRWLGINRVDHLARIASFQSPSLATAFFAARNLPHHPEYQEPGFFQGHDSCSSSILTGRGVLIDCRCDWASARPHDMVRYELQGTRASFLMVEGQPRIWIEDRSKTKPSGVAREWDPLDTYADDFEHPLWRRFGKQAKAEGHGGGDYFTLREFIGAIREQRPPEIDVRDAVLWSLVHPLSAESIRRGNSPVAFPDFLRSGPV
ncbi:MAG: gfo/Idh/MocA family oxidoreductase [Puniceicoccaceae bacterium]|nr:MAG: gfo/Idh/MocA family oxidoreductase [Puniceicoccaceae bacterium]